MRQPGRSLELYFVDGRPDGMLTAEVFNWTGHVLRAPRTQMREALARPEAGYTGIYLLLGEIEGRPRLYVGETEDLRERLRDHVKGKDWWESAVLITTAGDALHKAHVKYLESRLVEIARDVGAMDLENGNTPPRSSLSEAATASMESFINTLMMVLPAIRVDLFTARARHVSSTIANNETALGDAPTFTYLRPNLGLSARAILLENDFTVLTGSTLKKDFDQRYAGDRFSSLHKRLLAENVIEIRGEAAVFVKDFAFSSAKEAAKVILGRSNSSKTQWIHTGTGQTYAEWEAAQIEKDMP